MQVNSGDSPPDMASKSQSRWMISPTMAVAVSSIGAISTRAIRWLPCAVITACPVSISIPASVAARNNAPLGLALDHNRDTRPRIIKGQSGTIGIVIIRHNNGALSRQGRIAIDVGTYCPGQHDTRQVIASKYQWPFSAPCASTVCLARTFQSR